MNIVQAWNGEMPIDSNSRLLRRVLLGNATFSTLTGLLCLVDGAPLTRAFALPDSFLLPSLGAQLLLFATAIIWVATRQKISAPLSWTIVSLDIGWVIGSFALLPIISGTLSTAGIATLICVALGVAGFAAGQIAGLKRLQPI
jgi:hypothetical protein